MPYHDNYPEPPEDSESLIVPPEQRPEIPLQLEDMDLTLTWDNTTLRKYTVAGGHFDNILHHLGEAKYVCAFLAFMEEGQELKYHLERTNFPTVINPELDSEVIRLYSEREGGLLEDMIPESLE